MKREITIPTINGGKEFTVPDRTVGDRIKMYKQMKTEPKELQDDPDYRSTMEGAYLSLSVLQKRFKDLKISDILELSDEKLIELIGIVYYVDDSKIPKDFRETKTKTKP